MTAPSCFVAGGFHSRPAAGARAEAVVVQVGGESGHAVVVGTRDVDSLKAAGQGDADGAQIHNSVAVVTNGTVEVGTHGGLAGNPGRPGRRGVDWLAVLPPHEQVPMRYGEPRPVRQ